MADATRLTTMPMQVYFPRSEEILQFELDCETVHSVQKGILPVYSCLKLLQTQGVEEILRFTDAELEQALLLHIHQDLTVSDENGQQCQDREAVNTEQCVQVKDDKNASWSIQATKLLLDEYQKRKMKFDSGAIKKTSLWKEIAQELEQHSHKFTSVQVENKWKGLMKKYKAVKINNSKTGRSTQSCAFQSELDEIFEEDHRFVPPYLEASDVSSIPKARVPVYNIAFTSSSFPNSSAASSPSPDSLHAPTTSTNTSPPFSSSSPIPLSTITPTSSRKRKAEHPPDWFLEYRQEQARRHEESMELLRSQFVEFQTMMQPLVDVCKLLLQKEANK